jgi:uncharacterized protein YbjT (DUF2867 family)
METLIGPRTDVPSGTSESTFAIPVKPDVKIGLIAVDDIGAFAALAFDHPDEYLGKTLEIAGDIMTPPEVAEAFSRARDHHIDYVQVPIEALREQDEKVARAIDFLNETGYSANLACLRELYPSLTTLEIWLRTNR